MPESVRREIRLTIYTSGFSKTVRPGIRACVPCNATARAPRIAQEHPCSAETLAMLEYCRHILRRGNVIRPFRHAPPSCPSESSSGVVSRPASGTRRSRATSALKRSRPRRPGWFGGRRVTRNIAFASSRPPGGPPRPRPRPPGRAGPGGGTPWAPPRCGCDACRPSGPGGLECGPPA